MVPYSQKQIGLWLVAFCLVVLTPLGVSAQDTLADLGDCFTVTCAGQTVQVNPDGTFTIPNVSAPDAFGPEGPGSAPDGISDDFVRVVGVCRKADGTTVYAYSGFFKITAGANIDPGPITITDTPPIEPVSLSLTASEQTLTQDGQQTQIAVSATIGDGTQIDVTGADAWTSYRVSNTALATISPSGVLVAADPLVAGVVIVSALNDSVVGTVRVFLTPDAPLTDVEGLVVQVDGTPAPGADVTLVDLSLNTTTDADGKFSFAGLPGSVSPFFSFSVVWRNQQNIPTFAQAIVPVVQDGITDAGILALGAVSDVDDDNDTIPDNLELLAGLDPTLQDSDGDGTLDGDEDRDFDGVADAFEILLGTDPDVFDTDANGTSDGNEDFDNDGVSNRDEFDAGLQPFDVDSDGDGVTDGDEVNEGSDPADPNSQPLKRATSAAVSFFNAVEEVNQVTRLSRSVSFLNAPLTGHREGPVSQIVIFHNGIPDDQTRTPVSRPVLFLNAAPGDQVRTPVTRPVRFLNTAADDQIRTPVSRPVQFENSAP